MSSKRDREKLQQIQVFVRTRPLSTQEKEGRQTSCIEITGPKELSVRQQHGRKYVFDRVFAPHFKQVDVYKAVVYPLISEVLAGYNCTVFAYGQTGSGKTHTMIGDSRSNFEVPWQDDDSSGIIPRAMANLFEDLQLTQQEHTVRISYIELYNEEVYDLLAGNDDNDRIRLFEDQHQKGSVIIQGIEQVTVVNNKDVKKILDKGQEKRRTAATLMNSQSSRSHTVFTITVLTRETTIEGDVLVKTGKLNLVDLAGSENISRSGAVEKRAREAGNINQSLLTLGRVIKSLVERSGHVPYRESKLTRILQDSLGGRTKTSIIATISPAICNLEETLSTLEYAKRAQTIKNRPEINQRMSQKAVMDQCLEELEKCRRDLQASRSGSGVYLAQENYEQLIADNDNDKQELSLKIQHIRDLEKNLKELEDRRDELQLNWNEINDSFEKTKEELDACRERLLQTENEKNRQEFLANRYEEKAEQMYNEVQSLVTSIKTSKNIDAALREKIEKLYSTAKENRVSAKQMSNIVKNKFEDMCDDIVNYKENCKVNDNRMLSMLKNIQDKHTEYFDTNEAFMDYILCHWRTYAIAHQAFAENSKTELEIWMKQFVISCKNHVTEIKNQRDEEKLLIKKLTVLVENINTEHSQNFSKMKSQLENAHRATTDICHNFEEEFSNHTNDLLTDVSKLKVSTKMQIDQKDVEEQLALGQEAIKEIQKSVEFLRSNFEMLQNTCKASKEETSSNLSTVNKLECGITNLCSLKDMSIRQLITHNDESFSLLKKSHDYAEKNQVSGKNKQTKLLENLDVNGAKTDERLEEALVVNVEMQNDVFLIKNGNVFNTGNLELVTHGNELTNHVVQETTQVKNKALALTVNVNEVLHCVQAMADSTSQFENQLTQDISDCIDTVTTFTNVKYKEIIPSGDTPVRMQYHCPNLNPLTPKEKILGRFQERLRAMETIDEPNGDTETVN